MGEARRISFKVYGVDQDEIEQAAIKVAFGYFGASRTAFTLEFEEAKPEVRNLATQEVSMWCCEVMAIGGAEPA